MQYMCCFCCCHNNLRYTYLWQFQFVFEQTLNLQGTPCDASSFTTSNNGEGCTSAMANNSSALENSSAVMDASTSQREFNQQHSTISQVASAISQNEANHPSQFTSLLSVSNSLETYR